MPPIGEIDHLLTYVDDLDAAAALFRRMGFTLSPVSRIDAMGISNHLVLMRPLTAGFANFIELMASHDRSKLPPAMAAILSGEPRIKSMVLGTADAARAHAAVVAEGFETAAPVHVRREWVIGPGESVFPEFDVTLPLDNPLVFNCCRYFNVDLYLRGEWLVHPNGAQCLRSVFAVSADPDQLSLRFGRLFGDVPKPFAGGLRTSPGRVQLEIMHPDVAADRFGIEVEADAGRARYLGYGIEVSSLARLMACLNQGGVAYRRSGTAVYVDPAAGFGNMIMFTANGP